jgi:hypothetical protein
MNPKARKQMEREAKEKAKHDNKALFSTALHEAAHAYYFTKADLEIDQVTIDAQTIVVEKEHVIRKYCSKDEVFNPTGCTSLKESMRGKAVVRGALIKATLAGLSAVSVYLHGELDGGDSDLAELMNSGVSAEEARFCFRRLQDEMTSSSIRDTIYSIANKLVEKKTLTGEEISQIIGRK